jgi:hypothetical protein
VGQGGEPVTGEVFGQRRQVAVDPGGPVQGDVGLVDDAVDGLRTEDALWIIAAMALGPDLGALPTGGDLIDS